MRNEIFLALEIMTGVVLPEEGMAVLVHSRRTTSQVVCEHDWKPNLPYKSRLQQERPCIKLAIVNYTLIFRKLND